jgi:hypothetical protein
MDLAHLNVILTNIAKTMPSAGGFGFDTIPTYFSAPKAGKENDAPINGNINIPLDPHKKENEDLKRQNEVCPSVAVY